MATKKVIAFQLIAALLLFALSFGNVSAQEPCVAPNCVAVTPPIAARNVPELINSIVTAILGVVGAIALGMFVYGGLMWMTSAGNAQRIEKGKETLIWATTGLLVIFLSYGILNIILTALSGSNSS